MARDKCERQRQSWNYIRSNSLQPEFNRLPIVTSTPVTVSPNSSHSGPLQTAVYRNDRPSVVPQVKEFANRWRHLPCIDIRWPGQQAPLEGWSLLRCAFFSGEDNAGKNKPSCPTAPPSQFSSKKWPAPLRRRWPARPGLSR